MQFFVLMLNLSLLLFKSASEPRKSWKGLKKLKNQGFFENLYLSPEAFTHLYAYIARCTRCRRRFPESFIKFGLVRYGAWLLYWSPVELNLYSDSELTIFARKKFFFKTFFYRIVARRLAFPNICVLIFGEMTVMEKTMVFRWTSPKRSIFATFISQWGWPLEPKVFHQ